MSNTDAIIDLKRAVLKLQEVAVGQKALIDELTHEVNKLRRESLLANQEKSEAHVALFKMRRKWTPHVNGAKPAWERCDRCSADEACSCR